MLILSLGLDGADYELVRDLVAAGRMPTIERLAARGVLGPLESTIPAFSPTAWSSYLTGLNPGGHGIFGFSANPHRGHGGLENVTTRGGVPLWDLLHRADLRSAYVTIPMTHPAPDIDGIVVTGFGGPDRPQIRPASVASRFFAAHPDLAAARHPEALRWWEDFEPLVRLQEAHIEQLVDVTTLVLELEPRLSLLAVDFMASDVIGHFGWYRLDATHPAHRPQDAGDEIVRVYEMLDAACAEIVDRAEWLRGEEPTVMVLSDHGMRPTHWTFRVNRWLEEAGYLRFRSDVSSAGARPPWPRSLRASRRPAAPHPAVQRVDDEWPIDLDRSLVYSHGYGGQLYVAERFRGDARAKVADDVAAALASLAHPETGLPAFTVRFKEELYEGPYLDKAPEIVVIANDERIFVESSRRPGSADFQRLDHLGTAEARFSGQHGHRGILAAAGPGIRRTQLAEDAHIAQIPATLLTLLGVPVDMPSQPLTSIVDDTATRAVTTAVAGNGRTMTPSPTLPAREIYNAEEEARLLARLRDLGYE